VTDYLNDPVALIKHEFILEAGPYGEVIAPFQEAFFDAVFALRRDGRPKHRLVYEERRRGESKTEDLAAAALADLLVGPPRHRSFAVAAARDQAALILDSIAGFKARSAVLAEVEVLGNSVRNLANGSELKVMSSDDRVAYGIRPRKVFFDELSLQVDERLWNAMFSAIGKSPLAQMICASMAGWDFASLAWRIREQAIKNPEYYFATREGSELAPWLAVENMEEQRATLHPADFARFWDCRWVEPRGSWITREMYDSAEKGEEVQAGDEQHRRVGFVDVGLVHDPTAVAVCHQEGERVVLDTLRTLQGSRDEPVELEVLEDLVTDLTRRFAVKYWVFESPQAVASVQRLAARLPVQVVARYPTSETQARLWGGLYQLFANKRLVLFPHEQLRKESLSLVTKTIGGRLKVVESSAVHQDHILAVGGAAQILEDEKAKAAVAIFAGDPQSIERGWASEDDDLKDWQVLLSGPSILH
jgi:hypothetical protein